MYRVIIVDDELPVINSLKNRVNWKEQGFEVIGEARNGLAAYDLIVERRPDIVFTDIRMAGMTGLELIQKVNELKLDIIFVVISGYAEFAYAQKALNYGAAGFCLKPFDENEIAVILKNAKSRLLQMRKSHEAELLPLAEGMNDKGLLAKSDDPEATRLPNAVVGGTGSNTANYTYNRILKYMNENYASDISLQNIAVMFQSNPNYISQMFKKECGESFTEHLTKIRITHACQLLETEDLPVYEIAERAGYKDYFHFAKMFKRVTGRTPTDFRDSRGGC